MKKKVSFVIGIVTIVIISNFALEKCPENIDMTRFIS